MSAEKRASEARSAGRVNGWAVRVNKPADSLMSQSFYQLWIGKPGTRWKNWNRKLLTRWATTFPSKFPIYLAPRNKNFPSSQKTHFLGPLRSLSRWLIRRSSLHAKPIQEIALVPLNKNVSNYSILWEIKQIFHSNATLYDVVFM